MNGARNDNVLQKLHNLAHFNRASLGEREREREREEGGVNKNKEKKHGTN